MAYTVNKTDGSVFASVADGAIDTTSSLVLIGRNTTNYGEYIAENFIKGLENFAHTTAPASPLTGQLFFNKNDNLLRVYNGSDFERVSSVEVRNSAPSTNLTEGTMYFDTRDDELKVYKYVTDDRCMARVYHQSYICIIINLSMTLFINIDR